MHRNSLENNSISSEEEQWTEPNTLSVLSVLFLLYVFFLIENLATIICQKSCSAFFGYRKTLISLLICVANYSFNHTKFHPNYKGLSSFKMCKVGKFFTIGTETWCG